MYNFCKSIIVKTLALFFILFELPLALIIVVGIKLSSKGPVFFKQQRVGQYGRVFVLYKFRTMVHDFDPERDQIFVKKLIKGEYGKIGEGPVFKLMNDPRVTAFGKFLRKTSLDELPQLINVLKGDMSFVGPRPALPYEVELYTLRHKERLKVKPGITGLWQVKGRSMTTFDEMVELDLLYATKKSFILDLKILFKTIILVFRGKGAY
jgi:lipopolysaccharide/colanic/teichoic acid biosynthesis glycosyltransferase